MLHNTLFTLNTISSYMGIPFLADGKSNMRQFLNNCIFSIVHGGAKRVDLRGGTKISQGLNVLWREGESVSKNEKY